MKLLLIVMFALTANISLGSILTPWKYIKQYQLGIDVGETSDRAVFGFDIHPTIYNDTENCTLSDEANGMNTCSLTFNKSSSNYGIFLEQPFKRKGFWHVDWDISFALRSFSGDFEAPENVEKTTLPIQDVSLNYYGATTRLYATVGMTPKKWPEILISFGPTGEVFGGSAEFNGKKYPTKYTIRRSQVLNLFSYYSLDIVFLRFGKGYFGFTVSQHEGKDDVQEGRLLPEEDDLFTDLNVTMSRSFFGFKLLFK